MADLILERPGDQHFIRSISTEGIRVVDTYYTGPLLLSNDEIRTDWPPRSLEELRVEHLEAIFAMKPEVALLGTGPEHRLLPRELLIEVYRLGAGLEIMSTDAACRTFNVLVADGRKVVAGLLPHIG